MGNKKNMLRIAVKLFHGTQHVLGQKRKGWTKQEEKTATTSRCQEDTNTFLSLSAKQIKLEEKMKDSNSDFILFMAFSILKVSIEAVSKYAGTHKTENPNVVI